MEIQQNFDYIIAGAGASGLSLLYYLIIHDDFFGEKNILVIDSAFNTKADKTWCFWDHDHPFMPLADKSWNQLTVVSHGLEFQETLDNFEYHCIKSEVYQNRILNSARTSTNVQLLEANIQKFELSNKKGIVITNRGNFSADWVFQSVLKPPEFEESVADTSLIQHFTGWEVETVEQRFDPDNALLMDFDTNQEGGLTFFYVLPFSENRALIEYTIFSDQLLDKGDYESAIQFYLEKKLRLQNNQYQVLRKEHGSIPMEDRRVPGYYNQKVLNLGTVGGLTKPTTGYTFTRAHHHSNEIVNRLMLGKYPEPFSGSPYRYRVYDIMLLYLLKYEPESSRQIFHDLFQYNRIEKILRFLDEKTTFTEELEIFSTLPYTPFFRSIYRMKHRIFTGA
jgi:lycopene beta-cyclase